MRWRALPALLALLLLGAHLFRMGEMALLLPCLALGILAFRGRPWSDRLVQGSLLLAAAEWGRTLWLLRAMRLGLGLPWLRMSLILGAVAAFTLGAALLLRPALALADRQT